MTLTKADIVEHLVNRLDVPNKDATRYVDMIFETIKDTLAQGNGVKISGFGNWTVNQKRSRTGRNPQTGEAMEITARKVVKFKYSQVLRDIINNAEQPTPTPEAQDDLPYSRPLPFV